MEPKRQEEIEREVLGQPGGQPRVERFVGREDRTAYGAFRWGEKVTFRVRVPRALGCGAVVLRMGPDGADPTDRPLDFDGLEGGNDRYFLTVDTSALCPPSGGLFRYEFLFLRGERTLFTDSRNSVAFTLADHNANRFRLLVYSDGFVPPAWFRAGTMYHVFLDRFRRGAGDAPLHVGRLEPDWDHGTPQYAPRPGDELENDLFFGGNLQGVCEKLDFLRSLGVTVLYLSPVFEAASNHRYDTGDYEKIDSLLGGRPAFDELIAQAHARGMRVILDGVFNHTGDDSRYFNRRGHYPTVGAYQSEQSPYAGWYRFRAFPDDYECWWGVRILPRLNHENATCRAFFTGRDGIGARWIRAGADGWRLDVADELPDDFLDEFRASVKSAAPDRDPLILGEVWENAADKVAYGSLRRYLWGGQLDSVMNYPFRNAALAFLRDGNSRFFRDVLTELYASYPRAVSDSLMNLLGTHDTPRVLTALGDPTEGGDLGNAALAHRRLPPKVRAHAKRLLMIGSTLQFTVFGVPSVYYGDEAGLEGYRDPFCRMTYPWGREDRSLLAHYRRLGRLRATYAALQGGFRFLDSPDGTVLYLRTPAKPTKKPAKTDTRATSAASADPFAVAPLPAPSDDRSGLVVAANATDRAIPVRLPRGVDPAPILSVGWTGTGPSKSPRDRSDTSSAASLSPRPGEILLPPFSCAVFRRPGPRPV